MPQPCFLFLVQLAVIQTQHLHVLLLRLTLTLPLRLMMYAASACLHHQYQIQHCEFILSNVFVTHNLLLALNFSFHPTNEQFINLCDEVSIVGLRVACRREQSEFINGLHLSIRQLRHSMQ